MVGVIRFPAADGRPLLQGNFRAVPPVVRIRTARGRVLIGSRR
jgi:hypothetical protein